MSGQNEGVTSLVRRVVRILLRAIACVILLVVLLVALLFWYVTPPSDAALERRFYAHKAELEQIVRMMEQDTQMGGIAEDFTVNDDEEEHPMRERGISDQRWNEYREIFRRAGVPMGTVRQDGDIEILAWAAGLAIAGTSLSYLHCGKSSAAIASIYPACRERRESGKIQENDVLIRYKRIEGDWYIYEFSN
jgi:hypothetical protein